MLVVVDLIDIVVVFAGVVVFVIKVVVGIMVSFLRLL